MRSLRFITTYLLFDRNSAFACSCVRTSTSEKHSDNDSDSSAGCSVWIDRTHHATNENTDAQHEASRFFWYSASSSAHLFVTCRSVAAPSAFSLIVRRIPVSSALSKLARHAGCFSAISRMSATTSCFPGLSSAKKASIQ